MTGSLFGDAKQGRGVIERARLEAVLEQMPMGVVLAEPSGEIVFGNDTAAAVAGQVPTGRWDAFFEGLRLCRSDGRPYRLSLAQLVDGGRVCGERLVLERPDGTRAAVELNAAPVLNARGELLSALATLQDVTERERAERAKREFTTNAAHELRTPLTGIVSAVEVLQAGAKEIPEERDRFLGHIERECARLNRLARSLLTLARAQMGVEEPRLEPVRLRPLLDEVAGAQPAREGVEVRVECPPDLAMLVSRDLAHQLVENLVANAAKHTQEGTIRLVGAAIDEQAVSIEVVDTGAGMTTDVAERALEPFARGEEVDGSFGLGLAIAAELVERLGGAIVMESEPGAGTTVRLTLPAAKLVSG